MSQIKLTEDYLRVGYRVSEENTKIGDVGLTLPTSRFYGALITTAVLILGGCYAMYTSLENRIIALNESNEAKFLSFQNSDKDLLEELSRFSGQLDIILPIIQREVLEKVSVDPIKFGIAPIKTLPEGGLPEGWSVVDTNLIKNLMAAGKLELFDASPSNFEPYSVLKCSEDGIENKPALPCEKLEVVEGDFDVKLSKEFFDVFKELMVVPDKM